MNNFQKLVSQMAKDDLNKPLLISMGLSKKDYREVRNGYRKVLKGWPLERVRKLKNFNKTLKA